MILEKHIEDLVAFDADVRTKVEHAHQAKIDSKQRVTDDKKTIMEATWNDARRRVAEEKIKLDDYIKSADEDNQKAFHEAAEHLRKLYEQNKSKWVSELVDNSLKIR